jgi:hypothetical protein
VLIARHPDLLAPPEHPASVTVHPSGDIKQIHHHPPERDKQERPLRLMIITCPRLPARTAPGLRVLARLDSSRDMRRGLALGLNEPDVLVDKTLEGVDVIE